MSSTGNTFTFATATSTKSNNTVPAIINGITVTIAVARDLTIGAGDVLIVGKIGSQWTALGRSFGVAPGPAEITAPPPTLQTTVSGVLTVMPTYTGSFRDSKWRTDTTDLDQGTYGGYGNSRGVAFYGTKAQSLTGAVVTEASITVKRGIGGVVSADTPTLWLVTETAVTSGVPTLTTSTAGPTLKPNQQSSFIIPTAWAQSIVDGTAGGLAVYDASGSPYIKLIGRGTLSSSFALSISWQRG